ncbi:BQ2448_350 [Microbotryum intermedium]|uniref:BQ2448_350 protein n=1 Tax=Microbotryum intermedium TaxID=269621 RepID=A0A238F632_9BASI|nr:BQ2448_350 [Microbotryum intermedium]
MSSRWKWKHRVPAILPSGPSLLASAEERRTAAAAEEKLRGMITSEILLHQQESQGLQLSVSLDASNGPSSSRTAVSIDAQDLCGSAITQQILDWFIETLPLSPLNIHLHLHFNLPLPSKPSHKSSLSPEALRDWLSSTTSVHLTIRPLIAKLLPKLASRLANDRKSYTHLSKALNNIFKNFSPHSENWMDLQTVKRHLARLDVEDEQGGGPIVGMLSLIAKRYGNSDQWKGTTGKGREREAGLNRDDQGWNLLNLLLEGSDMELDHEQEEADDQSFESLLADEDHSSVDDEYFRAAELAADNEEQQVGPMEMLDLFD